MDPHQTSALNALAPFLALAPSATSPRAAADLISQATSAPNTYVFAELLQAPQIQHLRDAEPTWARWLRVLELFCWGTWAEYQGAFSPPSPLHPLPLSSPWRDLPAVPLTRPRPATPDLPTLSDAQAHKLRLLTLLSLASNPSSTTLTYPALQSALGLATPAALEALVTAAIYAALLQARLDPRAARVHVGGVAPLRDVAPGAVPALAGLLAAWEARCAGVLADVEARAAAVKRGARERENGRREWEGRWEELVKGREKEKEGAGANGLAGGSGGRGAKREGGEAGLEQGEEMDGEGTSREVKRGARFAGAGRRLGG